MAWTTPETAVAGDVLTAAWLNQNVRDNLNALDAAGANSTGLVRLASTSIGTSVSSVIGPANVFSADYNNYLVTIQITDGSTNSGVQLRMRAGSSTNSTSGNYNFAGVGVASNPLTATNDATTTTGNGFYALIQSTSGRTGYCAMNLFNPFATAYTGYTTLMSAFNSSLTSAIHRVYTGNMTVTTSYDSYELVPNSGTMTGGAITVYGYKV